MTRVYPLLSGYQRARLYSRLPEEYKAALRAIAKSENESMTWVVEQIIVDWIGARVRIAAPKYKKQTNLKLVMKKRKAS